MEIASDFCDTFAHFTSKFQNESFRGAGARQFQGALLPDSFLWVLRFIVKTDGFEERQTRTDQNCDTVAQNEVFVVTRAL